MYFYLAFTLKIINISIILNEDDIWNVLKMPTIALKWLEHIGGWFSMQKTGFYE